jgi:hypothetical protein
MYGGTDPGSTAVARAVDGIADAAVRAYGHALLAARPGKVDDILARDASPQSLATGLNAMMGGICMVCHGNPALDNLIMTSAAIDGHTELCAHECCTACWEMIALRADPDAADVPCPACRGDIRPLLASWHVVELGMRT